MTPSPLAPPTALVGGWLAAHWSSMLVHRWKPSRHHGGRYGPLSARSFGRGGHTLFLVHGLGATDDYWPRVYDQLGTNHRVVVPDPLGFGQSLDEGRDSFGLDDHLDALEECLDDAAPDTERLTIVTHSMGSSLGLALAERIGLVLNQIICCGPPIFPDRQRAEESIAGQGLMARLFLLDPIWARRFCAVNCRHRDLAGALAALAAPSFPIRLSRAASLHTWPAYRDSLAALILDFDWPKALGALPNRPTTLLWGSRDSIGDPAYAQHLEQTRSELCDRPTTTEIVTVSGAGHHLAISHPDEVLGRI